jgi:RHS repeat-associated protein
VSVVEGKINYVYNYTDHLGNIRLSYGLDPEVQGQLKILGENHYYPYRLKHSNYNAIEYAYKENELGTYVVLDPTQRSDYRYKYNGMEFQDELGLNLYDMDFRDYDPAIARWTGIDPVTHHNMSPYMAFDGNPVYWADPSGADSYDMAMGLFNSSKGGMTTYTPDGNGNFEQSGYIPDEFFTGSFMSSSIDVENGGGGSWNPLTKKILLDHIKSKFCPKCSTGKLNQMAGSKFELIFHAIMRAQLLGHNYKANTTKVAGNYKGNNRNSSRRNF